jgi:putative oxidoreductase
MLRKLIHTTDDYAIALLRVVLGIVFFAHGAQKVLGWFGGHGWAGSMNSFTQNLGIPALFAVLAILAEFLGGLGLIVGLLSRVAALGIAVEMVVAVFMVHLANGFFMNWTGTQQGEGFEYHLLAISMAIVIAYKGAGAFSLDHALEHWQSGSRGIPMGTPHIQQT